MKTDLPAFHCARGALALLLAATAGTLQAADTVETHNAAAGLVMTRGMFVDSTLGRWCGALPAPNGPSARAAQAGWEGRNAGPFPVGSLWIHALGDAAGAQLHDQRKAEFGDAVAHAADAVSGREGDAARLCPHHRGGGRGQF